jgi:hypothetical protein
MSQKERFNVNKTRRTSIEDLSVVGNELSEEHLSLISGGVGAQGTVTIRPIRTMVVQPGTSTATDKTCDYDNISYPD